MKNSCREPGCGEPPPTFVKRGQTHGRLSWPLWSSLLASRKATALACSQGHRRPTGADSHKCRSCSCCTIPNEAGRHRFRGTRTQVVKWLRVVSDTLCRSYGPFSNFNRADTGISSTRSNTGTVKSPTLLLIFDLQVCRTNQKLHMQQHWRHKKSSALPHFRSSHMQKQAEVAHAAALVR